MGAYQDNVREKLNEFDQAAGRLVADAGSRPDPSARACRTAGPKLAAATAKLRASLHITERTAADVADMRVRLQTEGNGLANALKDIGKAFPKLDDPTSAARRDPLLQHVYPLEEHAQRVAAALFPSAIDGLGDVNAALWQIRPVHRVYLGVLDIVTRTPPSGLSAAHLETAKAAAATIMGRFDAVDDLLDRLATEPLVGDSDDAATIIRQAKAALKASIDEAKNALTDRFQPFRDVLNGGDNVAKAVLEKFSKLRVPVFPRPEQLDAFVASVPAQLYRNLAGVERFALMNIGAGMRSIPFGPGPDDHLASPRFDIKVFDVFPDRVYFTASRDFLATVEALAKDVPGRRRVFASAPAGLHKFNEGSYKQVGGDKGNLQVSYLSGTDDHPTDRSRIRVDADIDLYRRTIAHLFGEVLVNHLRGSKTDQFKVFDILAEKQVAPLGGFDVIVV